MTDEGFEALADGSLLLIVLLVASTILVTFGHPTSRGDSSAYAEETRLALFGTTLDGLGYRAGDEAVGLRNGTTVESFLRLELHLLRNGSGSFDFSAANERIGDLAVRLVRPGWGLLIRGNLVGGPELIRVPDVAWTGDYAWSGWTYPPLDGVGEGSALGLAVWINPHR